jgi:peroxiredoxin
MNEAGPEAEAGAARRAARPYSIAVGIVFLGVLVYAGLNSLNSEPIGLDPGDKLPKFAAPSATGSVDKDANVSQREACRVATGGAVRICDYFDRPLVLVAWFTKGCDTCRRQLDTVEAARGRFPAVGFVGLDVRDSLENAGKEVRKHGWRFPMALDRDGAVSGLYGVGGGPTIFFAYPHGVLMSKTLGELDAAAFDRKVRALVAASRKRDAAGRRG